MRKSFINFEMIIFTLIFCVSSILATDIVPGKKQTKPIVLRGGNVHTVSGGTISNGVVVFENGLISAIGGSETSVPENAEIIDVNGKEIYPGLIDPISQIGLVEIGAVRATRDFSERGDINPQVLAEVAYNPDSEIIPTVRSNGITTALIVPTGGLFAGTSSLINLDGWTIEDAAEVHRVGVHLYWPAMDVSSRITDPKKRKEAQTDIDKKVAQIDAVFTEARGYLLSHAPRKKKDLRLEALLPVLRKEMPLFVHARTAAQIETALNFCRKQDLKMVLVGADEVLPYASVLKQRNIPVILKRIHSLPPTEDSDTDHFFKLPAQLQQSGVKYCLSNIGFFGAWDDRNLPFLAGTAAGHGLNQEQALRAITLSTAEILGVDKRMGSLEVGKEATIIVSSGDVLDMMSNNIEYEFIQGRKVDLDNRHKRLYRKYQQK